MQTHPCHLPRGASHGDQTPRSTSAGWCPGALGGRLGGRPRRGDRVHGGAWLRRGRARRAQRGTSGGRCLRVGQLTDDDVRLQPRVVRRSCRSPRT